MSEIEIQPPAELSEMERIRLKSIDPAFLEECRIVVRNNYDKRREIEYAEMLAARKISAAEENERTRKGFERFCRNYKPEDI